MKRAWDDPYYQVGRDNQWQARLRARQSWYRQHYLGVDGALYLVDRVLCAALPGKRDCLE